MKNLLTLFTVISVIILVNGYNERKRIIVGGIFHDDNKFERDAFNSSLERLNSKYPSYIFESKELIVSRTDSFEAQLEICKWGQDGVHVIFGPGTVETSGIVAAIADKFNIPHIIYHWKTKTTKPQNAITNYKMTFNFYPDSDSLALSLRKVLVDYDWDQYSIIYEDEENLIRLKQVLEIHDPKSDHQPINIQKLREDDYMSMIKEIKDQGDYRIVLDISKEKIIPFLKAAKEVNMLTDYNSYFITNLDTHTINFIKELGEDISYTNITSIRIFHPGNDESIEMKKNLPDNYQEYQDNEIPTEAALINDAVMMFGDKLVSFKQDNIEEIKFDCNDKIEQKQEQDQEETSSWGRDFVEYVQQKEKVNLIREGATGKIVFNHLNETNIGRRIDFQMEILELGKEGFNKIGTWEYNEGVKYDRVSDSPDETVKQNIQDKKFIVIMKIGKPFFIERTPPEGVVYEGNSRYEGYSVDLIKAIATEMKIREYEIREVRDGNYGTRGSNGKWNGIVRDLQDRVGDIGIADLTITYERRTAVDFTVPFMTLGIGILHVKPDPKEKDLFSFLKPFEVKVWLFTGFAYVSLSLVVFFLSRINQDDWESSHPCEKDPEEVESIWNFMNCIWLSMGSIMGQGCDILPKGSSTRIATGLWFFFALIMLASYTANLAAFLTSDRISNDISSAEDLVKQNKVKYGAVKDGSTHKFFRYSNFSTYQRMGIVMDNAGDVVLTDSNQKGVERIFKQKPNYAFLMESVPMEYQMNQNCSLRRVGELLDSKGYGIALPLNSPYRKFFSEAILKLSEKGELRKLKETHWNRVGGECNDPVDHDDLEISEVGGVFVVLLGGLLFALGIAIFEFLHNVEKIAIEQKILLWDALKSELYFAFNFRINTKPVRGKSSEGLAESRKSSLPRSLKSRSRFGSEPRSVNKKSTRSLNFDEGIHDSNSRSLLNLT